MKQHQVLDLVQKNPIELLHFISDVFGNKFLESSSFLELSCLVGQQWMQGRYIGLVDTSRGQNLVLEVGRSQDPNILIADITEIKAIQIQGVNNFLQTANLRLKENSSESMSKLSADRLMVELAGYLSVDKKSQLLIKFDWSSIEYTDDFSKKIKNILETTYDFLNSVPVASFQKIFGNKSIIFKNISAGDLNVNYLSSEIYIQANFNELKLATLNQQLNNQIKEV